MNPTFECLAMLAETATAKPETRGKSIDILESNTLGYHLRHEVDGTPTGSFEIFNSEEYDLDTDEYESGVYYWACSPGFLPDSDPVGPFASGVEALEDADPFNPLFRS